MIVREGKLIITIYDMQGGMRHRITRDYQDPDTCFLLPGPTNTVTGLSPYSLNPYVLHGIDLDRHSANALR